MTTVRKSDILAITVTFQNSVQKGLSPPRINSTEVTNEPTDWNDIMEQEETEDYESTTPQENCNTFDANSPEMSKSGRLLLDTGAGVNLLKVEYCETRYTLKEPRKIKLGNYEHQLRHITFRKVHDKTHAFLIIPNNFPLIEDGIIGLPFLKLHRYTITNDKLIMISFPCR